MLFQERSIDECGRFANFSLQIFLLVNSLRKNSFFEKMSLCLSLGNFHFHEPAYIVHWVEGKALSTDHDTLGFSFSQIGHFQ